jgi:hypothetical protein
MAKISMQFQISEAQKANIETWAAEHKISTGEAIRQAMAQLTGYDLANEDVGRKTKWSSPEERSAYHKAVARARQKRNTQVMRLVGAGKSREARELANAPLEVDWPPQSAES